MTKEEKPKKNPFAGIIRADAKRAKRAKAMQARADSMNRKIAKRKKDLGEAE